MKFCSLFFSKHTFAHCSQKVLFKKAVQPGLVSKMHQACFDVPCDAELCGEDTEKVFVLMTLP